MIRPAISSEILDRLPPQSLEAEKALLSSLLVDTKLLDDVGQTVRPEHFYSDANRKIYAAMLAMQDEARAVDAVTLPDRLKRDGDWEAIGGMAYLVEVTGASPFPSNITYYANIVRLAASRRQVIAVACGMLSAAYDRQTPLGEILATAETGLDAIQSGKVQAAPTPALAVAADAIAQIYRQHEGHERMGVPTGLPDFDTKIGGMQPSELCVLAARPSVGKTSLAAQIAYHNASKGRRVYFASLEQAQVELATRLICSLAGVSNAMVRSNRLQESDLTALRRGADKLGSSALIFDERPGLTTADIRRAARQAWRDGLDLIVIDYLQLITPLDHKAPREQQVSAQTKALRRLARELKIPVLCLAQLNRKSEEGERPRLSHLRESGAIEQDADVVWFLHRGDTCVNGAGRAGMTPRQRVEFIVAKNRNGRTGTIKLVFDPEITTFEAEVPANHVNESDQFAGQSEDF